MVQASMSQRHVARMLTYHSFQNNGDATNLTGVEIHIISTDSLNTITGGHNVIIREMYRHCNAVIKIHGHYTNYQKLP